MMKVKFIIWQFIYGQNVVFIENHIFPNNEQNLDVHGKTALDYALEGGNGKVAALFQELQNIKSEQRERPKAIDKALNDGCDFPEEVPDYNADAEVSSVFSATF